MYSSKSATVHPFKVGTNLLKQLRYLRLAGGKVQVSTQSVHSYIPTLIAPANPSWPGPHFFAKQWSFSTILFLPPPHFQTCFGAHAGWRFCSQKVKLEFSREHLLWALLLVMSLNATLEKQPPTFCTHIVVVDEKQQR